MSVSCEPIATWSQTLSIQFNLCIELPMLLLGSSKSHICIRNGRSVDTNLAADWDVWLRAVMVCDPGYCRRTLLRKCLSDKCPCIEGCAYRLSILICIITSSAWFLHSFCISWKNFSCANRLCMPMFCWLCYLRKKKYRANEWPSAPLVQF